MGYYNIEVEAKEGLVVKIKWKMKELEEKEEDGLGVYFI